ncbi:hypothetical protein F5Y15DRAFT_297691 [Xylariaceae sp. FL0016]|nr:hypothetical protein F5Y15DRAFT_297691 [Xylariaceae sp. FL0016]
MLWVLFSQRSPGRSSQSPTISLSTFVSWFCAAYVLHVAHFMLLRATGLALPNMSCTVLPVGIIFNFFVLYTGLYVPRPQGQDGLFWIKYYNVGMHSNQDRDRQEETALAFLFFSPFHAALIRHVRICHR